MAGYNHKGVPRSPETRGKIAEKARGRQVTADTRAKLAVAGTGRKASPETRSRLSEIRSGEANPMYGTVSPNRGPDYTPDQTEAGRRRMRKYRFGLTQGEYESLLAAQDGVCAACGLPETKRLRGAVTSLAVDHCHASSRVRSLLCNRCNCILGFARDDPAVLRQLIDYLKRHAET